MRDAFRGFDRTVQHWMQVVQILKPARRTCRAKVSNNSTHGAFSTQPARINLEAILKSRLQKFGFHATSKVLV